MNRDRESAAAAEPGETGEAQVVPVKPERPPLPGSDVFPAEADDDDPILAGLDEASSAAEENGGRRRRRRRRRGKGGELEGNGTSGVAPNGAQGRDEARDVREASPVREMREPREPREPREHRDQPRDHRDQPRESRDHRGQRDPRDFRDRDRERDHRDHRDRDRPRHAEPAVDLNREPGDGDLLGKDLADAAYHVLSRDNRAPASFARIADQLVRRGRLTGSPEALAPTVAAALRADVARASQRGMRCRFRIAQQRVSLTEWLLPREALRHEEQASQSAERQRDQVRRAFMQRLNDLPIAGFAEIIATWLNTEGVTGLRAVRRPGSSGRELHFAGTRRRGTEETRLAIVVQRAGRDLDRETVIATRGSLHHYASATNTWLITTGRVTSGAREEAVAEGAAPCALFEGVELAQSMERAGIGIRVHHVALCDIDLDLLEALGDTGETRSPMRDDGDRDRDRDRNHPGDRDRNRPGDRNQERMRGRDRGRDQRQQGSAGASEAPEGSVEGESEAAEGAGEEGAELESRSTDIFELRNPTEEGEDLSSAEESDQGDDDEGDADLDEGETEADADLDGASADDEALGDDDADEGDDGDEETDEEAEDTEDDERDSR